MNPKSFIRRVHNARRRYTLSPILVEIRRMGFMYYIVEVSKGANTIVHGYNNDLTNIRKARKKAKDMIKVFKSKNGNNRIIWKEY